jgi:adenosine deaminase
MDVAKLPKVDLHLHLDGSVKPETFVELAAAEGVALPGTDPETLASLMKVRGDCASLLEYLSKFEFVGRFLHTAQALERVAYELVGQASEQRCKYIEVRFGPQLHRARGLSADEVIHSVVEGLKRGEAAFGVKARGIVACLRNHEDALNRETLEAASRYVGRGIVAVDLAGDEANYPAERFADVFAIARRRDIPITIHAGEAAGPKNVYDAVTKLGAARIGHGVRLREDEETYRLIRDRRIPLEMCPISNIQTKASPSWSAYPIREYFDRELTLTVNTDNLTVSDTNLTKEYETLQERFGFRPAELKRLAMNGVDAAFLPDAEKRELRLDMEREFESLGIA